MKKMTLLYVSLFFSLSLFSQDYVLNQLEKSPRHHEWVKVTSGDRYVKCFVVYPEVSAKVPAIIVIHENRGLTDWVRSFSDQLAAKGYIAVAPDLLSDFSSEMKSTTDFPGSDDARNAIYELDQQQVENDLNAVQEYASQIKAANGKTAVAGFCWGGSQAFRLATYNDEVEAVFVFYGSAPDKDAIQHITVPVYGFYGGNDQRINAGIPETEEQMKNAGHKYEFVIYEGAGHGFMRQGDDPEASEANKQGRNQAWDRLLNILEDF